MRILYIDCESTGLEIGQDRVIEIACLLEDDSGPGERWESLVNPGIKIPAAATAIHGIKDQDVAAAPGFAEVFPKLATLVAATDVLAGFNVSFDLRILMAEALRVEKTLAIHAKRVWDMKTIYHHHEPRDLSAAFKFYCNAPHEAAHRAMGDVEATASVFKAQRERYALDMKNPEVLKYAQIKLPLDSNGAFVFNDRGEVELNFGKHKGKVAAPAVFEIKNYLNWMASGANFPEDTKRIARALHAGRIVTALNLAEISAGK